MSSESFSVEGTRGKIVVQHWTNAQPRFVVVIAHGYGEHAGRYAHVAERLVAEGASVYAPDHRGHGRSDGERALVDDLDATVEDLHRVVLRARDANAGLPLVLIGHSMGGLIAARYAQLHAGELTALVLSGPAVGANPQLIGLLEMDPIPDVPIDPQVLSRDSAVGAAYAQDPLVYHGPFQRATLEGLGVGIAAVAETGPISGPPILWIHGEEDALVPLEYTRPAMELIRGERCTEKIYPGARHEVFNETNSDEVLDDVVVFVRSQLSA